MGSVGANQPAELRDVSLRLDKCLKLPLPVFDNLITYEDIKVDQWVFMKVYVLVHDRTRSF